MPVRSVSAPLPSSWSFNPGMPASAWESRSRAPSPAPSLPLGPYPSSSPGACSPASSRPGTPMSQASSRPGTPPRHGAGSTQSSPPGTPFGTPFGAAEPRAASPQSPHGRAPGALALTPVAAEKSTPPAAGWGAHPLSSVRRSMPNLGGSEPHSAASGGGDPSPRPPLEVLLAPLPPSADEVKVLARLSQLRMALQEEHSGKADLQQKVGGGGRVDGAEAAGLRAGCPTGVLPCSVWLLAASTHFQGLWHLMCGRRLFQTLPMPGLHPSPPCAQTSNLHQALQASQQEGYAMQVQVATLQQSVALLGSSIQGRLSLAQGAVVAELQQELAEKNGAIAASEARLLSFQHQLDQLSSSFEAKLGAEQRERERLGAEAAQARLLCSARSRQLGQLQQELQQMSEALRAAEGEAGTAAHSRHGCGAACAGKRWHATTCMRCCLLLAQHSSLSNYNCLYANVCR